LHKKIPQKAGFVVLKTPAIPSILVETAFISNPKEEQRLNNNKEQDKIANAIYQGIINFYK
jgi:N-acetylmuramoyl-L-alanine amidase